MILRVGHLQTLICITKMLQELFDLVRSQAGAWRIGLEVAFDACVILIILNRVYVTASIYRNRPVSPPSSSHNVNNN